MALQVDEALRRGGLHERGVLLGVAGDEGHVHAAAVLRAGGTAKQRALVEEVVEQLRLFDVDLFKRRHAALRADPLEGQARDVDAEAVGRVEHAVRVGHLLEAHDLRGDGQLMAEQVLARDEDDHARGGDVLLRAGVDDAELADVIDLREDVGGHVGDQRHAVRLRDVVPAGAVDGVVGGDVDVFGVRGEGVIRDIAVAVLAGGAGDHDLAILLRLDERIVGEVAGIDVVGLAAVHQVEGHGGEHRGRAALQEHDLVALRDAHDLAQVGHGLLEDVQIHPGSMTHFHDGHAGTAIAQQILLHLLKHGQGEHGRARRKVVHAIHRQSASCFHPTGAPKCSLALEKRLFGMLILLSYHQIAGCAIQSSKFGRKM